MKKNLLSQKRFTLFFLFLGVILLSACSFNGGEAADKIIGNPNLEESDNSLVEDLRLDSQTWTWMKSEINNEEIVPNTEGVFTINFESDRASGTTDCNNYFSSFETEDNNLSFGPIASTLMYCENSQELEFTKSLSEVKSYRFDDGKLYLETETGLIIFE